MLSQFGCLSFFLFFLLIDIHVFAAPDLDAHKQIHVRSFGAIPDDGRNDAIPIQLALERARKVPGSVIYFEPGIYDFEMEEALSIEANALRGRYGENVQAVLFKPSAPYVIGLDLGGCRDVRIEAEGATVLFSGWYEAISIRNALNVKIKGLSIDYKRPPYTIGEIIDTQNGSFDIRFDNRLYSMLDSLITGRIHFYDVKKDRVYTAGNDEGKTLLNDSTIRIFSNANPPLNDLCILRHSAHYRAAILIKESKEIELIDVKIHSHPGMGVVGHRSENIMLHNLQVIPRPGTQISTNTDATHFTSCKGKIVLKDCKFAGQGDDCTNIHNYYYEIYPDAHDRRKVEIRIEQADLHALSLDYPDIADTLLLVDRSTLEPIANFKVMQVDTSSQLWRVSVTLDKPLSFDRSKYFLTNITRRPAVEILNNTVRSHLARAYLIKSKNVIIRGNTIQQSSGTAIQLGAELNWRESGPVENVLIENNYIIDCGYGHGIQDGTAINVDVSSVKSNPFLLNKNIVIKNNVIQAVGGQAIYIRGSKNVRVLNNKIFGALKDVVIVGGENYSVK
ncbi:MAG: right-handed parallel beta-helix repeat-containing protein [Sphingobacterium composti]|uniref:right-handed parallel beta-helix repeat-containing protein n=1 Tax=Sphingobacterium composti TaxID=363260 RepID=UPI0013592CD0|nr:right-handed parallel beta-helix repeat-containing protein [Sphingobacterium composti Ten et al. 2007 non Yoo et al. 2007]